MQIVERFEIAYYQYLNEQSKLNQDAPHVATDVPTLLTLYRLMVLAREIDAKAIRLQRTGMLGTYPSTRGQEAVFVGVGHALQQKDIFAPYYRDMATLIQRGVSLKEILLYWGGDERGNLFPKESRDFPFSVPVGSQPLYAAGAAFALKYRNEPQAVLVTLGDGATSEGDFYEALNVAGAWQLPIVFVICNNQWAISVPRSAQTAAHTLAQKAIAAGMPGEQIDGNDVIAVFHRTSEALKAAREQRTPRLLEMLCYRQHDHTTADDASRYEPKDAREREWQKEPIHRLKQFLIEKNALDAQKEKAIFEDCQEKINEAVAAYQATPPEAPENLFNYLYQTLPEAYHTQRETLSQIVRRARGK